MSVSITNGVKRTPFLNGESIEEFIDLTTLSKSVTAVPLGRQSDLDRLNIAILDKTIARKSEGKPYAEIYSDGSDVW
jgi:hypothetical protein